MAPKSYPEKPFITNKAERAVFEALNRELSDNSEIFCNYKFFDGETTREVDFIVLSPGHGVMFIEVKGGLITLSPEGKLQNTAGDIDPHKQVTGAMYSIRDIVHQKWSQKGKPIFGWMVVFPDYPIFDTVSTPTIPRNRIVGEMELPDIKDHLIRILHNTENATNSRQALEAISEVLKGIRNPETVYQEQWATIEDHREALTQEQQMLLRIAENLPSYIVRGPAGSGKTFLALEQARQHTKAGLNTALICYNVGLANFLRKTVSQWPQDERPKYVGTFHALLEDKWQVDHPVTNDKDYWNSASVEKAKNNLLNRPSLTKFDAFVVDEAQDFQYNWWTVLSLGFKDSDSPARFNAFGDIDQNIFPDESNLSFDFPPLTLHKNLRSSAEIVECASVLIGNQIEHPNLPGESVRFVPASSETAQLVADEVVDILLYDPFPAERLMLLTTNHRHQEQINRIDQRDRHGYWESYHDAEEVFYSHVSTFKGLERSAVVVAIDGWKDPETAREALYVAITRARDALVLVGDLAEIRERFGQEFAEYLHERTWEVAFEN